MRSFPDAGPGGMCGHRNREEGLRTGTSFRSEKAPRPGGARCRQTAPRADAPAIHDSPGPPSTSTLGSAWLPWTRRPALRAIRRRREAFAWKRLPAHPLYGLRGPCASGGCLNVGGLFTGRRVRLPGCVDERAVAGEGERCQNLCQESIPDCAASIRACLSSGNHWLTSGNRCTEDAASATFMSSTRFRRCPRFRFMRYGRGGRDRHPAVRSRCRGSASGRPLPGNAGA